MSSSTSTSNSVVDSIEFKLKQAVTGEAVEFSTEELKFLQEAVKFGKATDVAEGTPVVKTEFKAKETLVNLSCKVKDHCYVSLVKILPSFEGSQIANLEPALDNFAVGLGPLPLGKDVLVNLCVMEMVLNGEAPVASLRTDSEDYPSEYGVYLKPEAHLKTLSKMMESKYKYQFKDEGGRIHVENTGRCECEDILCDHGWSPRFILQVIMREGQRVGADIDFSKLFITTDDVPRESARDSIQKTPLSAHVDKTHDYDQRTVSPLRPKRQEAQNNSYHSRNSGVSFSPDVRGCDNDQSERLREKVSSDLVTMLEGHLDSRTDALHQALEMLMEEKRRKVERRQSNQVESGETSTDVDSEVESTISPMHSSSTLGRYKKSFMKSGPVYNVGKSSTVLAPVREVPFADFRETPEIAVGFVKTEAMARIEMETLDKVYTINGLACPFKNSRLNFLIHFHTALSTCGIDPKAEPIDALEFIGSMKPHNPTEELIKQCILRTFDFDEMTVIANPFKLPIIEVGMLVSESMLAKVLTMLRSEYQSVWFNEMKCLKVPSFHDEFSKFSTSVITRHNPRERVRHERVRRQSNHTSGESESGDRGTTLGRVSRTRKQRTLLGMPI